MRLIQSETIFVDHCHDTAESVKTIVHESVGYHHIRDGLMWFKNSRYARLKIEPNEDADITTFFRSVYGVAGRKPFDRTLSVRLEKGEVFLYKKGC